MVYLAKNKYDELGRNAHWQRFQFGKQDDIQCTLFHNTHDYK